MGKRLSRIYTRTGDKGTTGLGDGSRVDKDSPRIEAIGTIDELNSCIATIMASDIPDDICRLFTDIQHDLFDIGGELSIPRRHNLKDADIYRLEDVLDILNEKLPALEEFILPSGGQAASHCHLARSICRRAERRIFSLSREEDINTASLRYLNRLSDLLFVIARTLVRAENGEEVFWQPGRNR